MFRIGVRSLSTSHKLQTGLKERVTKFIAENPHLSATKSAVVPLDKTPPVKVKLDRLRKELLHELEMVDCDAPQTYLSRKINTKATKENPNLVPGNEPRKLHGCVCGDHMHHVSMHLLYRDYPVRCKCGYWFKLVSQADYESVREAHWQKIKSEPENAKLAATLDSSQAELNRLFEASKDMIRSSAGYREMLDKLSIEWKTFKKAYALIRKKMNDF